MAGGNFRHPYRQLPEGLRYEQEWNFRPVQKAASREPWVGNRDFRRGVQTSPQKLAHQPRRPDEPGGLQVGYLSRVPAEEARWVMTTV